MARLVVFAILACIQTAAQSWEDLRSLKPGDSIKVMDTGRREQKGAFAALSADAISLRTGNREVSIERTRVRRVQIRSGSRRARNAAIGAAVGVAIGVTVDQTLGAYLRNESNGSGRPVTYIAPIALFGGLAAAFPGYRTLYRAR